MQDSLNSQKTKFVDRLKVDIFLTVNRKKFPKDRIIGLKGQLCGVSDIQFSMLKFLEICDPVSILLFSFAFGEFGVDRFLLGQKGLGFLKLFINIFATIFMLITPFSKSEAVFYIAAALTVVGVFWLFFDWITIYKRTKKVNYNNLIKMMSLFH